MARAKIKENSVLQNRTSSQISSRVSNQVSKSRYVPRYIIGIDEVGRGPVAGPVTVCAVCIDTKCTDYIQFLKARTELKKKFSIDSFDSKSISEVKREQVCDVLEELFLKYKITYSIKQYSAIEIDKWGISICISKAIAHVVKSVVQDAVPVYEIQILLDGGLKAPQQYIHQTTIIKGDSKEVLIGLASVIAKVARDTYMKQISTKKALGYHIYGFEAHKPNSSQIMLAN
jgi:ribonuclease HII